MQLVSESVKSKQVQSLLQSEKQALGKQLQQINASLESLKTKIALTEDQVRFLFPCKGCHDNGLPLNQYKERTFLLFRR